MRAIQHQTRAPERAECDSDDIGIQTLIDTEFDGRPGLFAEFRALVGAGNRQRRWVVRAAEGAERVVAHAAWRPLRLRSHARTFDAAGIGLVTTTRASRGCGLATSLVEACVADARTQGAAVALLFSDARALYTRLGFAPVGRERRVSVTPRPARSDVRCAGPEDVDALHALLETQPLRAERSREEFARALEIPETHAWVSEGRRGIEAYAVEGKGRDLQGVIHEWAGAPVGVARIAGAVAAAREGPTVVVGPADLPAPIEGAASVVPFIQAKELRPGSLPPFYVWGLDSF